MSQKHSTEKPESSTPETQKQRWVKYGSNVALTIVVVIAVAILAIYLGQTYKKRSDTTASHTHSLSAPTVDFMRNMTAKVKLVSLYTKVKRPDENRSSTETPDPALRYREVADLLEEYSRYGNNVTVELIDPYAEPGRLDKFFEEVSRKYGNNVNVYKNALADFSKTVDQITRLIDDEVKAIKKVPSTKTSGLEVTMALIRQTVDQFPDNLRDLQTTLPAELNKANPNYKGAADAARTKLGELSRNIEDTINGFTQAATENEKVLRDLKETVAKQPPMAQSPERQSIEAIETFLAYGRDSTPRYKKIKQLADDLIGRLRNLGELKQLDELREKKTDSIVVMGEKDMIVIPRDRVFQPPLKIARALEGEPEHPRFAGEQQISTALVVLESERKPSVCFVRNGGPPLASNIENEQIHYSGPYYAVAERLREYNFEVVEKDLSGQWQQQIMELQMQYPDTRFPHDATDDEVKNSVWILQAGREVEQRDPRMPPPPQMGQKLAEHFAGGGSALVLFDVQDDPLLSALSAWGVSAQTNFVCFHDRPPETEGRVSDQVDQWRREQAVFVIDPSGDDVITRTVQSLDLMLVPVIPIQAAEQKGFKLTKLLPILDAKLPVYAKNIRQIHSRSIAFDAVNDLKSDAANPLYAGVSVEALTDSAAAPKGSRLVAIGCGAFANNQWASIREKDVQRGGSNAPRFPGNTELFTNSIFWLSKMENMMSIAPTGRDVALIAPMSASATSVWRIMVVGFVPLVVLLIGARLYFVRRD